MDTIILPLDGTPEAESAFTAVQALTNNQPAKIRLLYVGDDSDGSHQTYLEKIAKLFTGLGYEPTAQVLPGDPAQVIVQTAQVLEADLLVLKRDDREGLAGWILGSITDKVARELPCPLLLINPLPGDSRWVDLKIGHIMVPLDGSAAAETAIDAALPFAQRVGARLSVMYSVPWLQPTYAAPPEFLAVGSISAQTDATLEADMHAYLDGLAERYKDRLQLGRIAMRGPEADAVNVAAENHEVDLILMTTHGSGGMVHRGLGSVVDAVTKSSGVPVMLVRPLS
jgi:nucleotide-binding universal stress UspA family protein